MTERAIWHKLNNTANSEFDVLFNRIESPLTCPGHPDIIFAVKRKNQDLYTGRCGTIELKNANTVGGTKLRASQVLWFKERTRLCTNDYFLIKHGRIYSLIPGAEYANVAEMLAESGCKSGSIYSLSTLAVYESESIVRDVGLYETLLEG